MMHVAADGAEAVFTMLPAGDDVRSVYCGDGGLLAAAEPDTLLVDCSTIDLETARAVHEAARGAGFAMLDAPVSGGVGGAEAGTLTFMVGGTEDAVARAEPLMAAMGRNIVHAGGPGTGQAAKMCNNMILGVSMIAVSEAFVLAERVGARRPDPVRHRLDRPRGSAGRSPATARCRGRCRRRPPTATIRRASRRR